MDKKILESLGLSPREVKIYTSILKTGATTPAALAKATGVKRTTAYSIARGLAEKGLLLEDITKRPRTFAPATPKAVRELIDLEKKRREDRGRLFSELADNLSQIEIGKTYPVPQIRFIEEDKIEQFLLKEDSLWNKSLMKSDATWWGFQDHTYAELFPNVIESYWKKAPKEVTLKLLSNQSNAETRLRGKYPRRSVKFWDTGNFLSTIWVVGEYVITINTGRHPFYLVEMHDAMLAHDLRELFKSLWVSVP